MKCRFVCSLVKVSVLTSQASAGTMGPVMAIKAWTWVALQGRLCIQD